MKRSLSGFNALYPQPDMSPRIVGQTYCWLVLSLFPALDACALYHITNRSHHFYRPLHIHIYIIYVIILCCIHTFSFSEKKKEGFLLLSAWQRRSDVIAGVLSSAYFLLVVFPDTLPKDWLFLHYGTAMTGMGVAVLFQFNLPWRVLLATFSSYFLYYFTLTEHCISQGAQRSLAYDWSFTPGVMMKPGSLVMVILEWTLSFGAITVVVSYCCSEISKHQLKSARLEHV